MSCSVYGGIGAQAKALERLGVDFEHYRLCEIDKYAVKSYNAIHGTNFEPSDITKITGDDLGIVNTDKYCYIMTYSFPCFPADSLVLTDKGYKAIKDISCGDMVLTHDNTYQKVIKTFNNGVKPVLKINAMSVDEIKCTPNHKFYVRTMKRVGHKSLRTFGEPFWKSASELTKADYLGIAINNNSIIHKWDGVDYTWSDGRKSRHKNNLNELQAYSDFWWIIGRYIGDGWIRTQGGIIICCDNSEEKELIPKISRFFNYSISRERTVCKIHIPDKELSEFVKQFGKGAGNKHLNETILDLPKDLLKGFLDGYMSADGCVIGKLNKASSISRVLIYGIAQCVAKVYSLPYRIYSTNRKNKTIIEGREVNQKNSYEIVWKEKCKQDKAFYDNGHIWFPIKEITEIEAQNVYDFEVEKNHSFTIQNTIVHNCQDLSLAGKMNGMAKGSGTRSGLLWEVERLLTETKELPQVLLMENVPEVIGQKNIKHFAEWVKFLDELGYVSKWELLNAKDFGVPQNRNRCFMVSILGDYYYEFPQGRPLDKRLKDLLETKVEEKYYLKDKTVEMFIAHTDKQSAKGNGFKFEPTTGGGCAHSVLTRNGERPCDNFIISSSEEDRKGNRSSNDLNGERLQRLWQSGNDGNNREKTAILSRPHGYNQGGITQSEVYPTVRVSSTKDGNNGIVEKWSR